MSNNKATYWNRIASFYNKAFERKAVYQQMYQFVAEQLSKNMKVLEIGTGTGMIARYMANKVAMVEATDISAKMITEANRISHPENVRFSVADVFNLSYADAVFDVVVAANVLHIIPEPEKALSEIKRALKPNGLLIVPTFLWKEISPKGKIKRALMLISRFPIHGKWNEQSFIKLLEIYGFKVIRTRKLKSEFALCCVACCKTDSRSIN